MPSEKCDLSLDCPYAVTGDPQPHGPSTITNTIGKQLPGTIPRLWGVTPGDMGHSMGCRRVPWDCTKISHEMLQGGGTGRKREGYRPATGCTKSEDDS